MSYLNAAMERLKDQVIDMMYLVRGQLSKSRDAFLNKDLDLAREILHYEGRVNAAELSLDKDCESIFALYKPVAVDLRFVLAVLKTSTQLERMGDHAAGIAEYTLNLEETFDEQLIKNIRFKEMYDTVLSMIDDAIHAFNFENTKLARWVFGKDATINEINYHSIKVISAYAKENPDKIERCMMLHSVVKKIERVGDLTKNIAEETIFYTEAKVLKHKGKVS